ncbi:GPI-linked NAD(P)(+)--arginine ADP-ribosyltransferase 1-like isoform X2 [Salminus brasiliensis]|uniref:GPI-linked NAD(P)(+)--arginine ADP-ribosyltransferase 1-like isoform X2 n=1 Tax=Salminus brasiliensis TaxID=930266 RepID=UPI003B830FC8
MSLKASTSFRAKAKASALADRMECVNLLLLILLSRLSHAVRAEEKTLDMAPNAVDDDFSGCRDRMLQAVTEPGGLLQKELRARRDFAEMWNNSQTCKKQIPGLTPHHLTALQTYGNSKTQFRKTFNHNIHTSGSNSTTYKNQFTFKSLHFLLTDTMRHLNAGETCRLVYYGTSNRYTAETGMDIRFGKLIRSANEESLEKEKVEAGGEGTLFHITSCSVVNVENYTCSSEEIEQLISPTEVFRVENVRPVSNEDGDYNIITLTHSRFLSSHHCYLFDRAPGGSSSPALSSTVLALAVCILSVYYCTAPL